MAKKGKINKTMRDFKFGKKNMPKDKAKPKSVTGDQKPGAMERREKRLAGKAI